MSGAVLEQQINLYQPILAMERRLFSAKAIVLALLVMAVALGGLTAYGSLRTSRIERLVEQIARQEAASMSMTEQANSAARPAASLADLDAAAKDLAAEIDARRRALDIIHHSSVLPARGYAARLEALSHQQIDGVWLDTIILASGDAQLAMRGRATDSRLLPRYLAGLAHEDALAGMRFDQLSMRRAGPTEGPAQVVFDLDGPDLPLPEPEHAR